MLSILKKDASSTKKSDKITSGVLANPVSKTCTGKLLGDTKLRLPSWAL